MTTRESRMAIILLGFIGLAGFGFFTYQFVLVPLKNRDAQINALQDEVDNRMNHIRQIQKRKPDLEKQRLISLPQDIGTARLQYGEQLTKLFAASGFEPGSYSLTPKEVDNKNVPQLAKNKPIYTKLLFGVEAKGDLASLVDWMERFYNLRVLHRIQKLSVQRPLGADRSANPTDLTIVMTIEALVLDNAENRKTLLPEKPPELPSLLAPGRDYAAIAGKNIFFGAAPRQPYDGKPDVAPFVKLEGISKASNSDGAVATLWDQIHNYEYEIKPKSIGGFRVTASWYVNHRKKEWGTSSDLELRDNAEDADSRYQVVKIDDRDMVLVLRHEDKYYAMRVGQTLADLTTPLSKDQLGKLGIKVPPAPTASAAKAPDDEE